MSDRFYTTMKVSGPNAANAEKAAIYALKALDWDTYWAAWFEADEHRDYPCFFDHYSGEIAVQTIGGLSRKFPTETFALEVRGGMAEGIQGPVLITNGRVRDGRSESLAFGGYVPGCGKCKLDIHLVDLAEINKIIQSEGQETAHVQCPKCHTVYEYEVAVEFFGTTYEADVNEISIPNELLLPPQPKTAEESPAEADYTAQEGDFADPSDLLA